MWAIYGPTLMPTPRTFEKTKCVKNVINNDKKSLKKTFWGTLKNQRLDPKVCADPSWLLVFKNGLKKHSSLLND